MSVMAHVKHYILHRWIVRVFLDAPCSWWRCRWVWREVANWSWCSYHCAFFSRGSSEHWGRHLESRDSQWLTRDPIRHPSVCRFLPEPETTEVISQSKGYTQGQLATCQFCSYVKEQMTTQERLHPSYTLASRQQLQSEQRVEEIANIKVW